MRALLLAAVVLARGAAPAAAEAPRFDSGSPWTDDVSQAPVDPQSSAVIAWLEGAGGWGFGRFQIDFSLELATADAATPFHVFEPTADHYSPDCDLDAVPVPAGAVLEGESGLSCTTGGDCHLIVHDPLRRRLYEMWRADFTGGVFRGGCLAVWNLDGQYPRAGRGAQCTSADAAGLPIAPLLMDADEVASGVVTHAGRFALPNSRIRHRTYVYPATHATGAASGGPDAPPYGARFRLRADYPVASLPTPGARAVARALQRHGMFLADGGNVAFMVRSDRTTQAKWAGLLGPHDLRALQVTDFEMVDGGPRLAWNGDCQRLPRPHTPACADGVDNDDDGQTDAPADPGCAAASANDESPACSDGVDNDADGRIDWDGAGAGAPDPDCAAASGTAESLACGLGAELALGLPLLLHTRRRRTRRSLHRLPVGGDEGLAAGAEPQAG